MGKKTGTHNDVAEATTDGFSTALLAQLLLGSASPEAQQQASLVLRRCGGGDLEAEVGALAGQLAGLAAVGEDLVEVPLELGGVKVILTDTAGLRQTDCPVEAEGVRRARNALQQAHVVLSLGVAGMDQLLATLQQAVCSLVSGSGDGTGTALVTRARHRHHLAAVVAAIQRYEAVGPALELGCEELRTAARELGAVTGAIQTEQLLDKLFSEFCIGK
ncbi:tRNA modification GTPase MnmE [Chlorella vulgaris]